MLHAGLDLSRKKVDVCLLSDRGEHIDQFAVPPDVDTGRADRLTLRGMTIYRMDHAGVVVEDLAAAVAFFVELGLELEGEAAVEGEWVDQLVGLDGVRADIAFVRTPDGHGRVELSTFHTPVATSSAPRAPVNTPGIPRLTFVVDAVDDVLDRLRAHGAELVGEVAQYGDIYRYCYVRGPDGIIIGLVEELR